MQYKVVTVSKLSSYKSPETAVWRRFREFVALDQMLKIRFRGYFIPPRPEKNAVEGQRMKEGFIEERRVALEKYLNRLAAHPEIGPGEVKSLPFKLGHCLHFDKSSTCWSASNADGHNTIAMI